MQDDEDDKNKSVASDLLASDDDLDSPFEGGDDNINDPNDLNEISAKHTDRTPEAPDPDGPADPSATDGEA